MKPKRTSPGLAMIWKLTTRLGCLSATFTCLLTVPTLAAPRVVRTVPTDGAADIDPATREIVVTFDAAMKTDGFSVVQAGGGMFPEPDGDEPFAFRDSKTFVIRVKLAPNTAYSLGLNSASRRGFQSADGSPLAPTVIRFRTGDGTSKPPPAGRSALDDIYGSTPKPAPKPKPRQQPPPQPDRRQRPTPLPTVQLPTGWTMVDDKLFGTQVAVPPRWTPRVRGDVVLCIEPDDVPKAGAFCMPLMLKGPARPEDLADGLDAMLRRSLPDLRTQTVGKPSGDSIQRNLSATISGTSVVGSYRAAAARSGIGFIMGYLGPSDRIGALQPAFYKILASYRYNGPRMRLGPFKSAAIELRIPQGWQVWTSEGKGSGSQNIDWQVSNPEVPGARAFMVSPKYFSPNWVSDLATGQPDPQGLAIWRMKGFQMASFTSDQQAMQTALNQAMPGLHIVRQQSLDEVRQILNQVYGFAIQTMQQTGGRMTWYVFEILGRRQVQSAELRCLITFAMNAVYTPGGIKGTLGMWQAQVRGFEAPPGQFAQLATTLDRVNSSFAYTLWWIREVQKANAQQAKTIRDFWAHSNRIDKEIWDTHMKTQDAIHEMLYDTLTENYGYVNKDTGTIEKVPADRLDRFRREDGEIVSPEDVLDKHIPPDQATVLREAGADDYMNFDRRFMVWP